MDYDRVAIITTMKTRFWIDAALYLTVIVIGCFLYYVTEHRHENIFYGEVADRSDGGTKVAFFGDQGYRKSSQEVLRLVKRELPDLVVHLGDFDYRGSPDLWKKQIEKELGADVPYIPVPGNHEESNWEEYDIAIDEMVSKITDLECVGDIAIDMSCKYKNIHFIFSTPGMFGEKIGDTRNQTHTSFIKEHFASSTEPWKICAWHKNQRAMQVGQKNNETGFDIYEACREEGAMIATAHEHSYSRTHLLSNIKNQIISSTSSPYSLKKGVSLVFVSGLGGESIRPQYLEGDWWAKVYSSTQKAQPGALFCTFGTLIDPHKGKCYFKNIKGEIIDRFEIISAYGEEIE